MFVWYACDALAFAHAGVDEGWATERRVSFSVPDLLFLLTYPTVHAISTGKCSVIAMIMVLLPHCSITSASIVILSGQETITHLL